MSNYAEYISPNQRKTLRDESNPRGARLYIQNITDHDILIIEVDDVDIGIAKTRPDGTKLVDKMIIPDVLSTYMVELKGTDFEYSLKQIEDTIDYFKRTSTVSNYLHNKDTVLAYSVSFNGRVPASLSNTLLRKIAKLNKVKRELHEYIVFVRCVSKCNINYQYNPKEDAQMLNAPNYPLLIE